MESYGLVLCRSDLGDGGWSLHAPGATDSQIAEGEAPPILSGPAAYNHRIGRWRGPTQEDYRSADRLYRTAQPVPTYSGTQVVRFPDRLASEAPAALPSATLLMQTVVELGAQVDDGRLVIAVTWPWFDIIRALERDPEMAFRMTSRQWEEMLAGSYDRAGADEVILTPRSGDLGRDVIASFRAIGTIRVIDQVRAHQPSNLVTAEEVRALLGVLEADGASKGFLTTTADFAPKLREDRLLQPFLGRRLELVNGSQLLARLTELAKKK